jgi:hypothetical protein
LSVWRQKKKTNQRTKLSIHILDTIKSESTTRFKNRSSDRMMTSEWLVDVRTFDTQSIHIFGLVYYLSTSRNSPFYIRCYTYGKRSFDTIESESTTRFKNRSSDRMMTSDWLVDVSDDRYTTSHDRIVVGFTTTCAISAYLRQTTLSKGLENYFWWFDRSHINKYGSM